MKKILITSLVLMLALTMVCPSLAEGKRMNEPFTLRGMELFGMTKDQVIDAEKGRSLDDRGQKITIDSITLAGIPSSRLTYTFNASTDVCESVIYEFVTYFNRKNSSNSKSAYNNVYSTLVEKYGKPNWSQYLNKPMPPMMYNKPKIEELDSWLLEFDDCYVNIVLYKWNDQSTYYYCDVIYHIRSKEQMNNMWKTQKENEQRQQEQRNSDL